MLASTIRDVQGRVSSGASTTESITENVRRIAERDGASEPILCRTPGEVESADMIEWTELVQAARAQSLPDDALQYLDHVRQARMPTGKRHYEVFSALGGMPPTVAFVAAVANLDTPPERWSKAVKMMAVVREVLGDLVGLSPDARAKLVRAVTQGRPVHAFLRREANQAVLERAEDLDKRVRSGERLPLAGVTIGVKDALALGRTTAGSKILSDYTTPPGYVATAVQNLLDAGAVSLGKTNLDEFALGSSCTSTAYWPAPRNPFNGAHIAGGSSGGSAAAVAAGMVMGAIGSDTAGSIRVPASYCGIVGVKPTYGLVSRFGLVALASSMDCVGPMANSVTDAALLLGYMVGDQPDGYDQTVRRRPVASSHHPESYARPLFDRKVWAQRLRGMSVGIPIEYFLAHDVDDRNQIEELLDGPFNFERLQERRDETRLSGSHVGDFIKWIRQRSDIGETESLNEDHCQQLWTEFVLSPNFKPVQRDKLASCPRLWTELKELIEWLQTDYGVTFKLVSLPHTWLSIPVYFVVSREELASNLHRYDGLKYGRPKGLLAEPYEVAASRNRSLCFGAQPKQRILMGMHVLQWKNRKRLLVRAKRARSLIRKDFLRVFSQRIDLLLAPTVNTTAPVIGGFGDTVAEQYIDEFSVPANHAGVPAISVPLYREADGLWQSAQVIAPEFEEQRMFLLGAAVEEWHTRRIHS